MRLRGSHAICEATGFLALAVLWAGPARAGAQSAVVVNADSIAARVRAFAHDSMLGRAAGSQSYERAATYLAREVLRMGLRPGGDSSSFLQRIPLVEAQLDSQRTLLSREAVPGSRDGKRPGGPRLSFRQGIDFHPMVPIPGLSVPRTASVAGRTVYGGRLGSTTMVRPEQARGRIVVFRAPMRPDGGPDYQVWRLASELALYKDAAAILIVSIELIPPGVIEDWNRPRLEVREGGRTRGLLPPLVAITYATAWQLLIDNDESPPLSAESVGEERRQARVSYTTRSSVPRGVTSNIVAILPGADPQLGGEIVVVSASADHLGSAPTDPNARYFLPPPGDSVFNGANAGGSGAIAVLELAQWFSRQSNRLPRTVLFLWTAQAGSDAGASRFLDQWRSRDGRIVAHINLDRIGSAESARRSDGTFVLLDTSDVLRWVCTSNHNAFVRRGIPSVLVTTGGYTHLDLLSDNPEGLDYNHFTSVVRWTATFASDVARGAATAELRGAGTSLGCTKAGTEPGMSPH